MQTNTKNVILKFTVLLFVALIDANYLFKIDFIYAIFAITLLCFVIFIKEWELGHFFILFTLIGIGYNFFNPMIVSCVLPALSFLFVFPFPQMRKNILLWLNPGKLDRYSLGLALFIIIFSTAGLIFWGLNNHYSGEAINTLTSISQHPKFLILFFGIPIFAFVNAVFEETVFRGIMQTALSKIFGPGLFVIFLQASAFGAAHYITGFPNGTIGVLMTFVYGFAIGIIRERTNGILWPIAVHTIADFIIFNLVFWIII